MCRPTSVSGPDAHRPQHLRDAVGAGVELGVGERLGLEDDGGGVGRAGDLGLEQRVHAAVVVGGGGVVPGFEQAGALVGGHHRQTVDRQGLGGAVGDGVEQDAERGGQRPRPRRPRAGRRRRSVLAPPAPSTATVTQAPGDRVRRDRDRDVRGGDGGDRRVAGDEVEGEGSLAAAPGRARSRRPARRRRSSPPPGRSGPAPSRRRSRERRRRWRRRRRRGRAAARRPCARAQAATRGEQAVAGQAVGQLERDADEVGADRPPAPPAAAGPERASARRRRQCASAGASAGHRRGERLRGLGGERRQDRARERDRGRAHRIARHVGEPAEGDGARAGRDHEAVVEPPRARCRAPLRSGSEATVASPTSSSRPPASIFGRARGFQ